MDSSVSDEGKLFVGGIAWDTREETVRVYFNQFGEVTHAVIVRDKITGQARGFGFVVFSDPSVVDSVLRQKHTIDGRTVEVKRALSKGKQHSSSVGGQVYFRTKKIFVGGLPSSLTKVEFTEYFLNFGEITDSIIMFDQATGRSRGFGFITFDSEDAVDRVLSKNFHELSSKSVEVKRALPKEVSSGLGTRGRGRSPSAYGSYGTTTTALNAQMDSRGFLPLQPTLGGYPSYPPFGPLGYGYPFVSNGAMYGGIGAYALGNNENVAANQDGSALGFQQSVSSTGYISNAGLLKTPWGQAYGASGYGLNLNYGVNIPWSSAVINAPLGQSPRGWMPVVGSSNFHPSEDSYTDSGRSQTMNKNRRGSTKSNVNHNTCEVVHQAGGEGTKDRVYNSNSDS